MLEYNSDSQESIFTENTAAEHVATCTKYFFAKPALHLIETCCIVNSPRI